MKILRKELSQNMSNKDYTNTKFYKMLMTMAVKHLEKNYLDELSCEYLREKGNYEYAIRSLCKYLSKTDFDMNTHIIFSVPDKYVLDFFREYMDKHELEDPKAAVLFGKQVTILNSLLMKEIDVMHLWPTRDVICDCGTRCVLIKAENAYGHSATVKNNMKGRYYYRCPVCGAMVGTHMGTNISLGTPVNKLTAEMRKKTHDKMEEVMKTENLERTDLYNYLSDKLPGWEKGKVHVGHFDIPTCIKATKFLEQLDHFGVSQAISA